MAKKKRKKGGKNRHLKYGNAPENIKKDKTKVQAAGEKPFPQKEADDPVFKKELRKNLIFVGIFFLIIIGLYFLLAKTSLLNPLLQLIGLKNLY
ncbi:hypothetical protein C4544_05510 [candidate division WS5 bacterium]|uniref:Uncharacterized protein n=1 Tax=candidate division WS5 bacterium TaxID=2093353 RepID=A0A419DAT8_9BACT|nr:MAG: hypothetical protein C4544_05510 [candidate division WS5 bacterium]